MYKLLLTLLVLVGTAGSCVRAQDYDDPKFGRISDEDRRMLVYPQDSSAEAYVFFDRADVNYFWSDTDGPFLVVNQYRRLKLLKAASFDRADVTVTYDSRYEKVSKLDAAIHLPDGGTIKLKNKDFIREKISDYVYAIKWTFPQVTEGVTIEYTYNRQRDNITIPPRYFFQENIPVRHAEYRILIPPYYNYTSLSQTVDLAINENSQMPREFGPNFNNAGYGGTDRIPHTFRRFVMKDQAAYERQPYTNNFEDYINNIRFQLQSVQYPGRPLNKVYSDWRESAQSLYDNPSFGRNYRTKLNYNRVWKEVEPLLAAATTDQEKIAIAYRFVGKRLKWNDRYGIFSSATPDQCLSAGAGNSTDLNLTLLAILNEAGIQAWPVLIPMRDRGVPITTYPIMTQFDHTIVYAAVEGGGLFLDVGDADRSPGLPRIAALNGRGWLVDPENPRWLEINVPPSDQTVLLDIDLGDEDMAKVKMQSRQRNYYALTGRNQTNAMEKNSEGAIVSDIIKSFPEAKVISVDHRGEEEALSQYSQDAELEVPLAERMDDYIYVRPLIVPVFDKELKDTKQRLYPIDFPYPWMERYIVNLQIPEGYTVEEMPEPMKIVTPDKTASCTFVSRQAGQKVNVTFSVKMDRTYFAASEYESLRQLFERVIEFQESMIVLKKAK